MKSLDNNSYGDLINQNLDQKEMISPNEKSKSGYSLYTKKKVSNSSSVKKSPTDNNNQNNNINTNFNNNSFQCLLEDQNKENNNNNNISNYLVNQFLPEDIINGSSFDLNELNLQNKIHLPSSITTLIKELTKNDIIKEKLISLIKPKRIMRKNKKISFNFYRDELYNKPFIHYYSLNRLIKMLKESEKQFTFRNIMVKRKKRATFGKIYTNNPEETIFSQTQKILTPNKQNFSVSSKNISNFRMSYTQTMDIQNNLINNTNVNPNNNVYHVKTNSLSVHPSDSNLVTLGGEHALTLTNTNTSTNFNKKSKISKYKSLTTKESDILPPPQIQSTLTTTGTNFNVPVQRTYSEKQTPLLNSSSMTSLYLTKIPQKIKDESNLQLDMASSKAKDAARVVRRLEYSYNMKLSMMYSKPIHKKSAKIIQAWWRYISFQNKNKANVLKIQKLFRGYNSRKAFNSTVELHQRILPFLSTVDKIISRKTCEFVFDKLIPKYAYLKIFHIIKPKAMYIIQHMNAFSKQQKFNRYSRIISKKYIAKCRFTKIILDSQTKKKLNKLQSKVKTHLMHSNDKIMLKYGQEYHPYLYYKLKYNTSVYKKKIVSFRRFFQKVQELNLKANKNLNNKYEFLPYVLRKIFWNRFKSYYKDIFDEKDENKIKIRNLRELLKKKTKKDNKGELKKYFDRWRMYNMAYERYIKPSICDKLKYIDLVMKYHKKFDEKLFMMKLETIKEEKEEAEEDALTKLLEIYSKRNSDQYYNNVLNKYFQRWKKQNMCDKFLKNQKKLTGFCKKSLDKINLKKKEKLKKMLSIRETPLRESLQNWKFENIKFKIYSKKFFNKQKVNVLDEKRKKSLLKNMGSLEKRKHYLKRTSFKTFKINTGMDYRRCILSNIQISFFHKNRKFFALRKYRMLKYMINKLNNLKRINHWDIILSKKFQFWKSFGKYSQFNSIIRKKIILIDKISTNNLKQKYISWKRVALFTKLLLNTIFIQIKVKTFLRRKKEKN